MTCRYCGYENNSGEKFCASCGTAMVYHLGEREQIHDREEPEVAKEDVHKEEVNIADSNAGEVLDGATDQIPEEDEKKKTEPHNEVKPIPKKEKQKKKDLKPEDLVPYPEDDPRKKQAMKRKRRKAKKEEDRAAGRVPEERAKKPKKDKKEESIVPADSVEKDLQKMSAEKDVKTEGREPEKVEKPKADPKPEVKTEKKQEAKPEKEEKAQKSSEKVTTVKKQKSNKILWLILGLILLIYVIYKAAS